MPDPRHLPRRASMGPALLLVLLACGAVSADFLAAAPARAEAPDTLQFEPVERQISESAEANAEPLEPARTDAAQRAWLKVPFHEHLLSNGHAWPFHHRPSGSGLALDYNRVDELRLALSHQAQGRWTLAPRFAARLEYATGRRRWLYGAQLEQPLEPGNLFALGVSMIRTTDHLDLNQVDDLENSLAVLFGRQDYRDYFEREGVDAYAAASWPGVTQLSVHGRNDRYRSLEALDIRSLFHRERILRPNPAVAEGNVHAVAVRLERHARRSGGLYHWVELESAGGGLGGDFVYRRALADLRSVIRLSPAMTLALRAVGGSALSGALPPQRTFTVGGVDGLRAHSFGAFRGDQVALGQAEYTVGFGRRRSRDLEGLHAIVFVDAGTAWTSPDHDWDVGRRHFAADGGFGLSTGDDNLRLYFAKDLREPGSDFVISARLHRPF